MKKTLRKALACLLAVLMVVFSVPFSAMAAVTVGQPNQQWWTDEDLPITEAPEYTSFNSTYAFGKPLVQNILKTSANNKKRWNYKPMIGITVSNMGTADSTFEEMDNYQNSYYGIKGYADAENAGVLLDPTDLKAGQRIAVTYEWAGQDIWNNGQIIAYYNNEYITAGGYWDLAVDNECDTWDADESLAKDSNKPYAAALNIVKLIDDQRMSMSILAMVAQETITSSVFIGKSDEIFDAKFDGFVCGTFFFEVQQDCDLTEVLTLDSSGGGCYSEPIYRTVLQDNNIDNLYWFSMYDGYPDRCAMMILGPVWTNIAGGGSTECTHANLTKTDEVPATCLAAGTAAYWTCKDCGKMFSDASATTEISAPKTLAKLNHSYTGAIKSNGDKTHSYLCVNGCNQYGGKVNCTFGEMSTVKPPTITEEGIGRYTCGDCGYYYDVVLDKVECTHANLTKTDEVPATCLAAGTAAYWTCKDCGKMFSDASATTEISAPKTLAKLNHSYTGAIKSNGDKTHSYLCVNGCNQYGGKVNCNFGEMSIVKAPTITEEGIGRYTCGDCGYYYEVTLDKVTCTHEHTEIRDAKDAELDVPGYTGDTWCLDCGKKIATGTEIPALKGYTVTVDATDLGTVTLNGEDVTAGAAKRVLAGSKVTLTATPVEGATFVGWVANGSTTVSTDTTFVATALADITYTPVFAIDEADEFTVTFVDSFGNVVSAQTVTSGSAIVVPAAPTRPGYSAATENGWSMTNDEIAALTASATITAQYVKDAEKTFTVTATGCDIVVNGVTTADTATDVAYDTLVTVKAADATAWAIDGVTVAYGDTYTFYVGSNVTLTKVTNAVTATPTVANVSVTTTGATGAVQAVFTATRSMTDDCTFVDAGFVYGKGDLGDITLDDVTGTTVKAAYVKTPVEQFSLVYGLRAQTGSITARAFLAYVDAEGNGQVIYAAPQTFTY